MTWITLELGTHLRHIPERPVLSAPRASMALYPVGLLVSLRHNAVHPISGNQGVPMPSFSFKAIV
uniref:hypothetical protein n=1 Tax=Pseudomonas viridiflava TaxID=33069 RepID=UPI001980E663